MARYVDLTHAIENGMTTFEGQPAPVIAGYAERGAVYDRRFRFATGVLAPPDKVIKMVGSTGTLIDGPNYHFEEGLDAGSLPLETIAGLEAIVIRHPVEKCGRIIGLHALEDADLDGKAVLFHTGWSRHWRSFRYFKGWPYLSEDAGRALVERSVRLVGIDSLNIDITDDGRRPVHAILLSNKIPIVSHLTKLDAVPERGAKFFAVPLRIPGLATLPVRAFCVFEDEAAATG